VPSGSGGSKGGTTLFHPKLKVNMKACKATLIDISAIQIIHGDVTNQTAVNSVFEKSKIDGVIVALGGRTSKVGPTMLTDGTRNVINSMKQFGVKRVAVVTSIGVGDSAKQAPWMFRALMYTVMRRMFNDKNSQEQLFLSPDGPGHNLEYVMLH
jgi:hypothetical protein